MGPMAFFIFVPKSQLATTTTKTASRVLRRLLAEIKRRTDPVTIEINQSNSLHSVISRTSAGSNFVAQTRVKYYNFLVNLYIITMFDLYKFLDIDEHAFLQKNENCIPPNCLQ
ncbi:hypothetical protein V1478_003280 [Vespula squamosa]|uniref:Uncharacterized protein n=1 Tax=Vespula squamosa TaxID=30214 RepID=A0ABD2BSU4_VESSQ